MNPTYYFFIEYWDGKVLFEDGLTFSAVSNLEKFYNKISDYKMKKWGWGQVTSPKSLEQQLLEKKSAAFAQNLRKNAG